MQLGLALREWERGRKWLVHIVPLPTPSTKEGNVDELGMEDPSSPPWSPLPLP